MSLGFAITGRCEVETPGELRAALLEHETVRLAGQGSHQAWVPPPEGPTPTLVSTAKLSRILRLDPDDLTCSVEPGVPRAALDAALEEHRLELPCGGEGSLGGLFAADLAGPLAPGHPGARGLLLGLSGVLSDGTCFKAGARVVKNVAGFDLPKLFVGSRGQLFAVTEMHLKLRARPRAELHFAATDLEQARALELCGGLRRIPEAARCLLMQRDAGGAYSVTGTLGGHPTLLQRRQQEFDLDQRQGAPRWQLPAAGTGDELHCCTILFSRLPELLALLPSTSALRYAGERCCFTMPPGPHEEFLAAGAEVWTSWERLGASARPASAQVQALADALKLRLDPRGVLR